MDKLSVKGYEEQKERKMMRVKFAFGGVEYSVDSIFEFIKEDKSEFWSAPFFYFYPEIEKERYNKMNDQEKYEFLMGYFSDFYKKNQSILEEKRIRYNTYWKRYESQIIGALEERFKIDLSEVFNDLICYMTFNPISPRYLEKHTFDNFYLESERGALGTAMHEMIHFVWFYIWENILKMIPKSMKHHI